MKWVVGSIAVLAALVLGIAIGWTMRGRTEPARPFASATPPPPPPPLPPPPLSVTPPPPPLPTAIPIWTEDIEAFAWPPKASDDVVVVDSTHYLVKRAFLEKALANQELQKSVRIIPAMVDGGIIGVKIFGVRADSTVAKLGLKNGDTLESLNGLPLGSPDDALLAYSHVRTSKRFVLTLERAGASMAIHYRVLD